MTKPAQIEKAYEQAKERYAEYGVDTDAVLKRLATIPISIHCWQGDDVVGFEGMDVDLSGGIAVTGNYPGRARNLDELWSDLDKALELLPGKHRVNLQALYADFGGKKVDRDEQAPEHYQSWIDWAKERDLGLDLNPSLFSHPKSDSGFTLASADKEIRDFWIRHCKACRTIGEHIGRELGKTCVTNIWIADGYKDVPADRLAPRARLKDALDEIFSQPIDEKHNLDALESKLFGLGSECYVVGSLEFYLGYAVANNKLMCFDTGHFHPTEVVSDKLSSALLYLDKLFLHVSRGVRWDSDHVLTLSEETTAIAQELVRGDFLDRVYIGIDFFDGSINRVAAWVIGTRAMIKSLLIALLEPRERIQAVEAKEDFTSRLAMHEEFKTLPFGAVWDYYCQQQETAPEDAWLAEIKRYEKDVQSKRD